MFIYPGFALNLIILVHEVSEVLKSFCKNKNNC